MQSSGSFRWFVAASFVSALGILPGACRAPEEGDPAPAGGSGSRTAAAPATAGSPAALTDAEGVPHPATPARPAPSPAPERETAPPTPVPEAAEILARGRPYVYTRWEQFTSADGLPNDHVFAVRADGPLVWVGTEDGLARIDKRTREIRSWREADGLPWRVVSAIDVHPGTGDVWLGLFGGGLARFSAGRFDHWHQLNSGLINDVVYGVAVENDNIWAATTAGASRYDTIGDKWSMYTEKNAPMEEIWNYGCCAGSGKVWLGVWGSGVLEFDCETETWKDYLDPDGEMEIDLYRDDGIVHVITTGVSHAEGILWVSTYFGACRYDGRHWRGYFEHECGLPSDFNNAVRARSAHEAWYCTDRGVGAVVDFETDTWVTYTSDHAKGTGRAVIQQGPKVLEVVETPYSIPHNYVLWADFDGDDVWVATSKGLARGIGEGYYPRLRARSLAEPTGAGAAESAGGNASRDG